MKKSVRTMVVTALLAALIVLFGMYLTVLGYPRIGIVQITTLGLFVIIGAITEGPAVGAVLGAVFGLTSFLQCFGMDFFGTTLFGISPWKTAVLCFVPRILMGLLAGLLFKLLRKVNVKNVPAAGITCFCGALMNTVFFMGTLFLLFWNTDYLHTFGGTVIEVFVALAGINALVEVVFNTVLGTAISAVLLRAYRK